MRAWACVAWMVVCGCARTAPVFTNVGNGVYVPTERIAEYADKHRVTHDQARDALATEITQQQKRMAEASAMDRN